MIQNRLVMPLLLAFGLAAAVPAQAQILNKPFSAWPTGDTIAVHLPVGDITVRATSDDRDRVDVRPQGSWRDRRGVTVLNARVGSIGTAVIRLPHRQVRVDGLEGEHRLPLSERGLFDGSEATAEDALVLSGTEGHRVSANVEIFLSPGTHARVTWAAGTAAVDGTATTWTAEGTPTTLLLVAEGGEIRVVDPSP